MKIAVVGANGREGKLITVVKKGQDVTAFVRKSKQTAARKAIIKDVFDLTKEDLEGFDAVVDAPGGWTAETVDVIDRGEKHLADLISGAPVRLAVVGEAGSLDTNPEHTLTEADAADFPDIFKPVAAVHAKALDDLRSRTDLNWTYISPAADFQADSPKTGRVIEASENFTLNDKGQSVISYADYADAFASEIVNGHHSKERISYLQS